MSSDILQNMLEIFLFQSKNYTVKNLSGKDRCKLNHMLLKAPGIIFSVA